MWDPLGNPAHLPHMNTQRRCSLTGMIVKARIGLIVLCGTLLGCGEGKGDASIAKALETKSDMEVAAAAVAEKKQEDAKVAKAEKDAEESARTAEIAAAATLPATLPGSLEDACDAFVEKYDQFMLAGEEKEVLQWWDGHRKKLGEARSKCLVRKSIEVAACSTNALGAPLPSLKGLPRIDSARRIVEACIAAHGTDA